MKLTRNLTASFGTSKRGDAQGFYWWRWLPRVDVNKTNDDYLMVFVFYVRWLCFDLLIQRIKKEPGFEQHFRTNW